MEFKFKLIMAQTKPAQTNPEYLEYFILRLKETSPILSRIPTQPTLTQSLLKSSIEAHMLNIRHCQVTDQLNLNLNF